MDRTPVPPRRVALVVWFPLLAMALVLASLPDTTQAPPTPLGAQAFPVGAAALRVRLDPETGTFVHDGRGLEANKAPDLEIMLSRSDAGLVEEFLPNGTVRVNLQGRFQNASVAHIGDDGRVHTTCTDLLHEAQGHLAGCKHATPQAPALEVK